MSALNIVTHTHHRRHPVIVVVVMSRVCRCFDGVVPPPRHPTRPRSWRSTIIVLICSVYPASELSKPIYSMCVYCLPARALHSYLPLLQQHDTVNDTECQRTATPPPPQQQQGEYGMCIAR